MLGERNLKEAIFEKGYYIRCILRDLEQFGRTNFGREISAFHAIGRFQVIEPECCVNAFRFRVQVTRK